MFILQTYLFRHFHQDTSFFRVHLRGENAEKTKQNKKTQNPKYPKNKDNAFSKKTRYTKDLWFDPLIQSLAITLDFLYLLSWSTPSVSFGRELNRPVWGLIQFYLKVSCRLIQQCYTKHASTSLPLPTLGKFHWLLDYTTFGFSFYGIPYGIDVRFIIHCCCHDAKGEFPVRGCWLHVLGSESLPSADLQLWSE